MSASPTPVDPDSQLLALRERLRAARAERGSCPPWAELRDDLLPGGTGRAGRDERLAHKELCPYCTEHVKDWEKSLDKASDTLGAMPAASSPAPGRWRAWGGARTAPRMPRRPSRPSSPRRRKSPRPQ